jgi:hypothetical protein
MRISKKIRKALEARWQRAWEGLLSQKYQIKRCPQGGYWVINREEGKVYRVTFPNPLGECTCPDWRGRRLPCKHIFIVAITHGEPFDVWLRKVEEYDPKQPKQPNPKPEPVPVDRDWVWGTE